MMSLSNFIRKHRDEIVDAFEVFARTMMPAGENMVPAQLRDHADEMLAALVADMDAIQSEEEQSRKSRGLGMEHRMAPSGLLHANARIRHGFTPAQMLAEFRALRASVLRLYENSGDVDLSGVRRFNEGIDEVLAESMTHYAAATDLYRDQFVGVLGHDLRSPLNAITAGAHLLEVSADPDQRQARVATSIVRSAQRMARMIDDLTDLTVVRLGGALPLRRVPTDLERVCQESLLELQTAYPAAAVQFESNGDLRGEWDAERLAQLLSNLLANAIQHGAGDTVRLTAQGGAEEVVVSVHNLGAPIPAEAQHGIFESLVSHAAREAGQPRHMGLGLFIARAVVSSHGGTIDVASSEGSGTTFTVRLPRTVSKAL